MFDIHLGPVDQPVGLVQGVDPFGADAVTLQANHVDATNLGWVAIHQHEARDVVDDPRLTADKAEPADRHVVVDGDSAADARMGFDVNVPAKHRPVGDRDPVAELAVVGDVRAGHEEVVAADPGDAVFLLGARG